MPIFQIDEHLVHFLEGHRKEVEWYFWSLLNEVLQREYLQQLAENYDEKWEKETEMEGDNFFNVKEWFLEVMVDDEANNILQSVQANDPKKIRQIFERMTYVGTSFVQQGIRSAMNQQSWLWKKAEKESCKE